MKRNHNNIEERALDAERVICEDYNLTPEEYLELWHETGCRFAEELFGRKKSNAVHLYISSPVYWYYWASEWLNTCEVFIDWDYSYKSIELLVSMQLQTKRPWKLLHEKIVEHKESVRHV